jgi:hypothetical protein
VTRDPGGFVPIVHADIKEMNATFSVSDRYGFAIGSKPDGVEASVTIQTS